MKDTTPNHREPLWARNSITGQAEYITSTNHVLDVGATFSASSIAISDGVTPSTKASVVQSISDPTKYGLVSLNPDGSNISGGGGSGGTQYTDGGVPPAHPIGNALEWSDGSNWQTVSTAKPLPVTATFSPSGTQDINLKQINGNTTSVGNGVAGTGVQRVTIASDNTAFAVNATLSAETTKVIGTVNQGTSPWVTSNATTSVVGNGAAATAQRVTLANDSTGIIATVGAVTAITNALPTGTNSIGKISDITTSVVPGTAATNLGKAEDAAHTSGDTGVFALAVRNDNLATTYGADQDYSPIATDLNGRVMVAQKAATATLSNVASSASSVTVLAANSARIGATITNDSSALLYVKFGTTASTASYTVVLAGAASAPFAYYEVPAGYTGRIDGIWNSATGNARVTEIT